MEEKFLKLAFDYFDVDKNGQITLKELKKIFKESSDFPEEEFNKCLKDSDLDSDGQINYNEFSNMMKHILA